MSLIMVMLILVVVSILGVGASQIAIMSERGSRNDRDQQVAWQAAEAALVDAEYDMRDTAPATSRQTLFDAKNQVAFFSGCGTASSVTGGGSVGLCALNLSGKPAWLTVDFTVTGASAATTAVGTFTGRSFAAGGVGVQPAQKPRYVIEVLPDPSGDASNPTVIYRVTAMGFGPRTDIQAMLQMIYRI
jgi:type IV pilus assembly protein PilX